MEGSQFRMIKAEAVVAVLNGSECWSYDGFGDGDDCVSLMVVCREWWSGHGCINT